MNTYPTYPQSWGTQPGQKSGLKARRTIDGTLYVKSLWSSSKFAVPVKHENLTTVQKDALVAFYKANEILAFNFVYQGDNVTRVCRFVDGPKWYMVPGGTWYFEVPVEEV